MRIDFTDAQLDYVARVLAQRPWAEVHELLEIIRQQVEGQQGNLVPKPNGMETRVPKEQ